MWAEVEDRVIARDYPPLHVTRAHSDLMAPAVTERWSAAGSERALEVMVLAANPIYRAGLVASLTSVPDVDPVHEVATTHEAMEHPAAATCDVIIIDSEQLGGVNAVRELRHVCHGEIVVCSSLCDEDDLVGSVAAGAVAYLSKHTMTPAALQAAVFATANGGGAIAPELLGLLLRRIMRDPGSHLVPPDLTLARLTDREERVLRMVADGHCTREIAVQLAYSERTVKNVLHDVIQKLNARTRSQAVAQAVRCGLI
jgi:DNA-binding NarL/FixJ family response regulator